MRILTIVLALLWNLSPSLGQVLSTDGDNSPAVIAQSFSAIYGVRADAVEAILWVYEAEGYDVERRRRATEEILRRYAQSPDKKEERQELSETTCQNLGITNFPGITTALEWDMFANNYYLSTTGHNSPAVVARGQVKIWYGIPPKALRALASQLEKNRTAFAEMQVDFNAKLSEQVKKYQELKNELSTYSSKEEIYEQAEALLENGNLKEAERLIETNFDASMKRQAYKGFIFGKTKELLLKYDEASRGYANAVHNDENNSTYHLYYAHNEYILANYNVAIKHYEIALGLDSLLSGNEKRIITLLNNLGSSWDAKGDYKQAISYYEKALEIGLQTYGVDNAELSSTYNNLGLTLDAKGDFNQAITYFEKTLQLDQQVYGGDSPKIAMVYNNLGSSLFAKGDYDQAVDYFEKALQIYLQTFNGKHPEVANTYNNLGTTFHFQKDYDLASVYFEKALLIFIEVYGERHPRIAAVYNNLGSILNADKKYDQAIHHFEKALQIDLYTFGEQHPSLATRYNNLGLSYKGKKDYKQAITYFEKALQVDLHTYGEEHPNVATRYNNLGSTWSAKRDYNQAILCYEKSQTILDLFYAPSHPYQKTTAKNLSLAANEKGKELLSENKYLEALQSFQIAKQNAELAQDNVLTFTCLNNVGSTQKYLHYYAEGLQSLDAGLIKATLWNQQVDKYIETEMSDEMRENLEVQNGIEILRHMDLVRLMQYHKIGCLDGLDRDQEAENLARQLWRVCRELNENDLIRRLMKDGYDFGL